MKQRTMKITAVACGAACAVCIGAFLASVQGQANAERAEVLARYGGEQVEVCVATRDIAAGERLDASAVETRLWVADLLPEQAVREMGDAVGQTATTSILKGEAISAKRFENERGMLEVPTGKEAVSVPAKAVQAVGGAIRAGMSVDVYAAGDSSTTVIAEDVVVLDTSVGGSSSLVSSDAGWVTLAVDPDRVQEVIAAASRTTLYFVVPGESAPSVPAGDGGSGGAASSEPAGEEVISSSAAASGASDASGESPGESKPGRSGSSTDSDGEKR